MEEDKEQNFEEEINSSRIKDIINNGQRKQKKAKKFIKVVTAIKATMVFIFLQLKIILLIIGITVLIAMFNMILQENEKMDSELQEVIEMSDLQQYLFQFSHSSIDEVPQSADGKYYKMYSDGIWLTIGSSDLQWSSHKDKFACTGRVLTSDGTEIEVDNVENYVDDIVNEYIGDFIGPIKYSREDADNMNIYIEKELVDKVGADLAENYYNSVVQKTKDLDLSKQQLYALVAIQYNFGNLPEKNGQTFLSVYEKAGSSYAINSWEFNKYIWDNWWAYLGGGMAGHIPARDAQFETYVKGIYDFNNSDAGGVFVRKYYIYYTAEQLAMFDYAPQKDITRSEANEQSIFEYNLGI